MTMGLAAGDKVEAQQGCGGFIRSGRVGETVAGTSCPPDGGDGGATQLADASGGAPAPAGPPLLYKPFVEVGGAEPCVAAVGYGPEEYGMLADGSLNLASLAELGPA